MAGEIDVDVLGIVAVAFFSNVCIPTFATSRRLKASTASASVARGQVGSGKRNT